MEDKKKRTRKQRAEDKQIKLFEYPVKEIEPDLFPEPIRDTTNKELF